MAGTARKERELKEKFEKLKYDPNISPLEQLRAYVLTRGVNGLKSLHRLFKRVDENKDATLDFKEFQAVIARAGISVDPSVMKRCFDEIDRDKTGRIDVEELIIALRPPMSSQRKLLIQQAFIKADRTGDGVIKVEDLRGVYSPKKHPKYLSGEMTEDDVLKQFLKTFNGPGQTDDVVTREDFENYYAAVSASIDSDVYFDLMMRQAWNL